MNYRIYVREVVSKEGICDMIDDHTYDIESFVDGIIETKESNKSLGVSEVETELATLKNGGYRITFFSDDGWDLCFVDFDIVVDNIEFKDLRKLFKL